MGKHFGTATQPNKPARSTVQVGLATPGALVEIELVAVKKVNKNGSGRRPEQGAGRTAL